MLELQTWLDNAATLRRCIVRFDGYHWTVEVSILSNFLAPGEKPLVGLGEGPSVTFAAVAAILDLQRSKA